MPFYLESLDGTQNYKADVFCNREDLIEGKIYDLTELGFSEWFTTGGKKAQKKLKTVWYGSKI